MPWLIVERWAGEDRASAVAMFELSDHDKWKIRQKFVRAIPIDEKDAQLPIDVLARLYRQQIEAPKNEAQARADAAAKAKVKIAENDRAAGPHH